ncbi:MAG: type I DNA topoisomerase [Lachnospiraceae bacterium]|nr:type I DNA topoisomerase [Lachnospiraceae bacterium]
MAKNLVIVESPAKAKTIKKFLGTNYEVMASNGHVRDLPKSQMGVDIKNDFEPKYITIRGKGDLLAALRREVKKADKVYLATDPDREGEAISWHLVTALNLEGKNFSRITFNEITKNAVKNSIKSAREIDMDLVDAQQARRVLDRMLGYSISPLLWKKVKRGLSAGRVQSVALKVICDREDQINAFIPEEYWTIEAVLNAEGNKKPVIAGFYGTDKKKMNVTSEKEAEKIADAVKDAQFKVSEVKKGERTRKAPLPFTTSTLQQEASKVLGFSTQKTMRVAQQLYEGVDVKGHGTIGLISYLRTDSTRISEEADKAAKDFIKENYGDKFVAAGTADKKSGAKIQDAHEAIRPTYAEITPVIAKDSLSKEQFKLYQLIWKRFIASRMKPAVYETVSVKIDAAGYRFTTSASKLVFDGFMSVYAPEDDEKDENTFKGTLSEDTKLTLSDIKKDQHFTQAPPHFTEASLVKTLEEIGVGRPSTYAPTITTLLARRYVVKEGKNLFVSELGFAVNDIMKDAFPAIVDVDFTANMEDLLDGVEEGNVTWKTIIRNFYPDLETAVEKANEALEKVEIADEVSDEKCDACGRNLVVKYGPHGKFLACPGFPECKFTKPFLEKIGVKCPKCGKDIVMRMSAKGRRYYACEKVPECDFMTWQMPAGKMCPKCGDVLVIKGSKLACNNSKCSYTEDAPKKEA